MISASNESGRPQILLHYPQLAVKKRVLIKVVIFGLTLMVIIALIWLVPALIKLRRQAIKEKPFPLHWEAIIKQNLIFYKHFPPSLRKRLQGHVNVILAEKQFVGCGGLQITEEIKLTIAAISARAAVE